MPGFLDSGFSVLKPLENTVKGVDDTPTIYALLGRHGVPNGPGTVKTDFGDLKVPNVRLFWTAVILAESGGDAKRHNSSLDYVIGLGQVNQQAHSKYDPKKLEEPDYNIRAMKDISGGWKNAGPWDAVTNGAFKQYMVEASKKAPLKNGKADTGIYGTIQDTVVGATGPVGQALNGVSDLGLGSVSDTLQLVGKLINALFDPAMYFRLGKGLIGVVLVLLAIAALLKQYVPTPSVKL